jgi:ATP-dependent exoDNAse (exonuclease V) beta subunit
MYVAATRAKSELHLIGSAKIDDNGAPAAPRPGSLLAQLWPAVRDAFAGELVGTSARESPRAAPAAEPARKLRRLPPDWIAPEPAEARVRLPAPLVQAPPPGDDIEFEWAGRTIQHVGTAFHRCIRLLAEEPGASRAADRIRSLRAAQEFMLRDLGVPDAELERAADDVEIALRNLLDDERGRWLFDGAHAEPRNEYALSGLHRGMLASVILDRTFVAGDGTRWIVDYKTSRHEGPDLDAFLDRERERYRAQLDRYAAILSGLDRRPIRLGLYFPLLKGWREWEWDG